MNCRTGKSGAAFGGEVTLTLPGRIAKVALCFWGCGGCVMKEGVLLVWLELDDHLAG